MDPESRLSEKPLWVQKSLLQETHRAVVLSAQAVEPAGPPAVTAHAGVVVINTVGIYCHSHTCTAEAVGSGSENRFPS